MLEDKRTNVTKLCQMMFDDIMKVGQEIRNDPKERTGIVAFARRIGTDDFLRVEIENPSERARFFAIEKGVRSETHGHTTSQQSEDDAKMHWRGSITMSSTGLQASVSGLQGDEDVAIAIAILAKISGDNFEQIISDIKADNPQIESFEEMSKFYLPDWCVDEDHYLYKLMVEVENFMIY